MTVETLTIQPPSEGRTVVRFDDERERAVKGECDEWAVASLTLVSEVGEEETWGEFLDLEDVEKLHAWTGELLEEARSRPRVGLIRTV